MMALEARVRAPLLMVGAKAEMVEAPKRAAVAAAA